MDEYQLYSALLQLELPWKAVNPGQELCKIVGVEVIHHRVSHVLANDDFVYCPRFFSQLDV